MTGLSIDKTSLTSLLDSNIVDFLDLGCGIGGSYGYIRKLTGLRIGVSLDIDPAKVTECRKVNDLSWVFDVVDIPHSLGAVSSAYMIHFLEHLPSEQHALEVIRAALSATRDYVFIRQPYFDHDDELAAMGLKTYWSDWTGHKNPMKTSFITDLVSACDPLIQRLRVFGIDRIVDSNNPAVLPLSALPNQHDYSPERHGPKPDLRIEVPCFREVLVILERQALSEKSSIALAKILSSVESRAELLSEVDAAARPRRRAGSRA